LRPQAVLTERERKVVRETADGNTVNEIAGLLTLSTNTVKFHLKNAAAEFRVTNKTAPRLLASRTRRPGRARHDEPCAGVSPMTPQEVQGKQLALRALARRAHVQLLTQVRSQLHDALGAPLTAREPEVLRWAAEGKAAHDTAEVLGIQLTPCVITSAKPSASCR
jgi:DNA-binding CsgD family transcriptional regulator